MYILMFNDRAISIKYFPKWRTYGYTGRRRQLWYFNWHILYIITITFLNLLSNFNVSNFGLIQVTLKNLTSAMIWKKINFSQKESKIKTKSIKWTYSKEWLQTNCIQGWIEGWKQRTTKNLPNIRESWCPHPLIELLKKNLWRIKDHGPPAAL